MASRITRSVHRVGLLAVLFLAGPMFAGPASAFWSADGTGAAGAAVATLQPPTGVTASVSAGASTVRISWTPPSAPDGGAVDGFYVQRFAGAAAGPACATSPTSLTWGSGCEDRGVADGTYTYKVTAVFRSWTATSAASAPVTVAALHRLTVTTTASATVGTPVTVTVTARDASGATIPGYLGTVRFTGTDSRATLPADYTFVAGDAGTRTFAGGVTFRTSGSQTVTATDTGQTAATGSATVAVSPAAASRLVFSQQPTSTTAGATIAPAVTVRVEDQFGNLTAGTAPVGLAVTGGAATLNGTTTRAAVAGVASFADLSVTTAGTYTFTATSAGLSAATSTSFTITAAVGSRLCVVLTQPTCTGATVNVERGSTTSTQIRLFDRYGNPATATSAISVALSGAGQIGLPTPAIVTIGAGATTSGAFSVTMQTGSTKVGTVTAAATGITSASVTLRSS